jgi:hypothetical protein
MAKDGKGSNRAHRPRPPFRAIEGIGSKAWGYLSRNAVFVLVEFYRKFNGYNRYDLSLTYGEVKSKMTNRPFSDALLELVSFGFIDMRRYGRLERHCSIYGLSNRWRRLDKQPQKLAEIEPLVNQIKFLRREPGDVKKRMEISKLRKNILKLGTG